MKFTIAALLLITSQTFASSQDYRGAVNALELGITLPREITNSIS